ncbi:MAG: tetratricopeptide repeat protein [Bacteroidetes bacterium]|nr:tetratricopeptide repeat protein [Bacteroidota bacterium]
MADKKETVANTNNDAVIAQAKDVWTKYGKYIIGIAAAIILIVGGIYVYKNFFKNPKEAKASDAMFMAENYFRKDSINLALNGDGPNAGFLKIIKNYSGTDAANLANFYAGVCYVKLNENDKAVTYLKNFSTDSKPVQARAYKLLGDAYGDLGKNADALSYYKKAAHTFEDDKESSSNALFSAAYLADRVMKDSKQAIDLYKELKTKFPDTQAGRNADNYLAQLGVL